MNKYTNLTKQIIKAFIKMDVAIFIFVFLMVGSVVGTIILQMQPVDFYTDRYGPFWGDIILTLGFNNAYYAYWYILFFALLMFSLVCCVLINGKPIYKSIFKPVTLLSLSDKKVKIIDQINSKTDYENYIKQNSFKLEDLENYNAKKLAKDNIIKVAYKNKVAHKIGYFATHIGMLFICVGGLLNGFVGFKSDLDLIAGEQYSKSVIYKDAKPDYLVNLPFIIQAESLEIKRFSSNTVSEYVTKIKVLDKISKSLLTEHDLKVNSPLFINDFGLYQSTVYENVKNISLAAFDLRSKTASNLNLKLNQEQELENSKYIIKVTRFNKNTLVPDPKITNRFVEIDLGPSIEYEISAPDSLTAAYRVYLDHKDLLGIGFLDNQGVMSYQTVPIALDSSNNKMLTLFSQMLDKDQHRQFKLDLEDYLANSKANKAEFIAQLIHAERVYSNIENNIIVDLKSVDYQDVSGIQINYNPSAKVFFFASFLLCLGVILMLYYRLRVLIVIRNDKGVKAYEY